MSNPQQAECPNCHGGDNFAQYICEFCNGTGKVHAPAPIEAQEAKCPTCHTSHGILSTAYISPVGPIDGRFCPDPFHSTHDRGCGYTGFTPPPTTHPETTPDDELEKRMRQFADDIKNMPDSTTSDTHSALIERALDEADWIERWHTQTAARMAVDEMKGALKIAKGNNNEAAAFYIRHRLFGLQRQLKEEDHHEQ